MERTEGAAVTNTSANSSHDWGRRQCPINIRPPRRNSGWNMKGMTGALSVLYCTFPSPLRSKTMNVPLSKSWLLARTRLEMVLNAESAVATEVAVISAARPSTRSGLWLNK